MKIGKADGFSKESILLGFEELPSLRRRVRKHWATMLWLEQVIYKEQ